MSDKISVQQRKYFVERIENSINDKIDELKQSNAAEVQNISEAAFGKYLKLLKVDKDMKEFTTLDAKHEKLRSKLISVFNEVKKTVSKNRNGGWDSNEPNIYNSSHGQSHAVELTQGFRWCCNKTAAKNVNDTPAGQLIRDLEAKKRAAIDELHGINELDGLKLTVNNILKGADVPLLGE